MESELTRAQALFSIDVDLEKTFIQTVGEFNRMHNPSGTPCKDIKRPRELGQSRNQGIEAGESESQGICLTPCSKSAEDLEAEDFFVFQHTATPTYNIEFKLYVSQDGSKLYLQSSKDGIFFCPVGHFVGTFLQGQPAKTSMEGDSEWIDRVHSKLTAWNPRSRRARRSPQWQGPMCCQHLRLNVPPSRTSCNNSTSVARRNIISSLTRWPVTRLGR